MAAGVTDGLFYPISHEAIRYCPFSHESLGSSELAVAEDFNDGGVGAVV